MIPTTTHPSVLATPQQLELLHLPDELIGHIAIRIRGVDSLLNFARTCRRFAGVSRAPLFKAALTDNFVTESEMKYESDDPDALAEGCTSDNDFNGSSIEMDVMRSDYRYFWELHKSANFPESLDPALAQRFFTMLGLVHDDMVRHTIQADLMEQHLYFAKMLPALPWRENGKACLHWLENVSRHHKGTATYSSKPPSDSQESSNDEDESDEFPPLVGYVHYTPFPIEAWKALEHVDPPASTSKNSAASH